MSNIASIFTADSPNDDYSDFAAMQNRQLAFVLE